MGPGCGAVWAAIYCDPLAGAFEDVLDFANELATLLEILRNEKPMANCGFRLRYGLTVVVVVVVDPVVAVAMVVGNTLL